MWERPLLPVRAADELVVEAAADELVVKAAAGDGAAAPAAAEAGYSFFLFLLSGLGDFRRFLDRSSRKLVACC